MDAVTISNIRPAYGMAAGGWKMEIQQGGGFKGKVGPRHQSHAAFHAPAQRLRWNRRQRAHIFRLLLQDFGRRIRNMTKGNYHAIAAAWRRTVESWPRCQRLICIRQGQKKGSTTVPENGSRD